MVDIFYRVHTKLDDPDDVAHLIYDFINIHEAVKFAEVAFMASDNYKVWLEILENECTTSQSPLIRRPETI